MNDFTTLVIGIAISIIIGLLFKSSIIDLVFYVLTLVIFSLMKIDKDFRAGFNSTF